VQMHNVQLRSPTLIQISDRLRPLSKWAMPMCFTFPVTLISLESVKQRDNVHLRVVVVFL